MKKREQTISAGVVTLLALGFSESAMSLRDLYKKHHWQVSGATFSQMHELFDRHHSKQHGFHGHQKAVRRCQSR